MGPGERSARQDVAGRSNRVGQPLHRELVAVAGLQDRDQNAGGCLPWKRGASMKAKRFAKRGVQTGATALVTLIVGAGNASAIDTTATTNTAPTTAPTTTTPA